MLNAERINQLKAKVKTEMARRSGNGSLANFAGSDFDFADVPSTQTQRSDYLRMTQKSYQLELWAGHTCKKQKF